MNGGEGFDEEVRVAQAEDREALERLCFSLHAENGIFKLSERKMRGLLDRAFDHNFAVLGVIGPVGAPVACIYLAIEQPYYSDDFHLLEMWSYVHPDHRRSKYAAKLIDYAKNCSERLHIPLIIGIVSNHRTEAKMRLYDRRLHRAGAYYYHGPLPEGLQ